jgi:hypothetical protein
MTTVATTKKPATRKQTQIQAATVNRVIDKASKKVLGYLVKSDSEQGVWYQVTWNREEHRYECTCPATKPCKHERAVSEVVKARKAIEAEKKPAVAQAEENTTPQPVATEAEQATTPQRYCEVCSCVGKLRVVDGLNLCPTCAQATKPANPASARATAPLGSNKVFSLMR